jgi:hypothetical protein
MKSAIGFVGGDGVGQLEGQHIVKLVSDPWSAWAKNLAHFVEDRPSACLSVTPQGVGVFAPSPR